ncbi:MAG: hypothetical protein ABR595_02040 [Psychroflexus sp.]
MKKIFLTSLIACLGLFIISCDSDDYDENFQNNPESGWIEFENATQTECLITGDTIASMKVFLEVPINRGGTEVNYSVEKVSGNGTVNEGNFILNIPESSRIGTINFELDTDVQENYEVLFTINSVSKDDVIIGLDGLEGDEAEGNIHPTELLLSVNAEEPIFNQSNWDVASEVCVGDGEGNCDPESTGITFDSSIEMTPGENTNEFTISDITGGLYGQGFEGGQPNPADVVADLNAGTLSVSSQTNVLGRGAISATGTFNLDENCNLESFEITWSAANGDSGTNVYTVPE